jgi:DNA invertase Pin-like site-specific DNA recombinase
MNTEKKVERACLCARYSTSSQRKESLDDQWADCEEVAAREGFTVVTKFGDKEFSGGTADRPGYQTMLAAARRREFDIIVVEDVSRLWRNRAEFGPRSAELEDLKIDLLTAVGDDTRQRWLGNYSPIQTSHGGAGAKSRLHSHSPRP